MIAKNSNTPKTFAAFGDIHGRITLMLILSRLWERESGRALDGVLQVGDFGAYPDLGRLDDATARFARDDPDELGYSEYMAGCAEGAALLDGPGWPVHWIRGNHEDFDYLARFREPRAVDPWRRLIFVPDGTRATAAGVRLAALGGQAPRRERGRGKKARKRFRAHLRRRDPRAFSLRLAGSAFADGAVDVLMTHAAPRTAETPWGSPDLSALDERVRPRVHLFGHHHVQIGPVAGPGDCVLIGLDHLGFHGERLQTGCWGILELGPDTEGDAVRWTWGDEVPWREWVTRSSYRSLL